MSRPQKSLKYGHGLASGLQLMRRAADVLGNRVVSKRTRAGKALLAWREDLVSDLGGPESISSQEAALLDVAVRTKWILDSVDAWIISQPSPVSNKTRGVLTAVRDRAALAGTLKGCLEAVGMRRRSKPVPSLEQYVAEFDATKAGEPADAVEAVPGSRNGTPDEPETTA
jgi:hypothetical protein